MPPINELTKNSIVPVSLSLLLALVGGVWFLANQVSDYNTRLTNLEKKTNFRWNYLMMREYGREAERLNEGFKSPNVTTIRADLSMP